MPSKVRIPHFLCCTFQPGYLQARYECLSTPRAIDDIELRVIALDESLCKAEGGVAEEVIPDGTAYSKKVHIQLVSAYEIKNSIQDLHRNGGK